MTRWQVYLVLGLGLFGLGLGTGLGWGAHRAGAKAAHYEALSQQAEGIAKDHAAQAAASDRQATEQAKTVQDADARAAAAKRELDRSLKALPVNAPASIKERGVAASLPSIPDGRASIESTALLQAQAVIADQQAQIDARDRLIASLTKARDEWKASAEQSQEALRLERIAHEAEIHSESRRGFLHSLETGAVSAALGYAAGRAR